MSDMERTNEQALCDQCARMRRLELAENRLRQLVFLRGLKWDEMTDEQRIDFVDDLIHEDRSCGASGTSPSQSS